MPVTRGGRRLMRARLNLAAAGLTEGQWRDRWDAARLFLTADGEKDKAWGNETIRWHPDEGWLEIKLPVPLAHLANRPRGRYRLSCEVRFQYRGDEVAAQAASGAVRYDICVDPVRGRWYIDASWKTPARPAPALDGLRSWPVVAVDVNAGHLAVAVLAPDGNVTGTPFTIPLELAGLPAAARDGRVRAAVSELIATARQAGARAVVIEDLDFARAREQGREETGNRPARGGRGRGFRRLVAGIPTAPVPGQAGPDDRQRRPVRGRGRPGLYQPLGGAALARPAARASPRDDRPPRRGAGDRQTRPGHRAGNRANGNRAAPEDAARPARARTRNHPPATARTKETRRPTGHPAATAAQDRNAPQDHGGHPGARRPLAGTHPADSHYRPVLRNGVVTVADGGDRHQRPPHRLTQSVDAGLGRVPLEQVHDDRAVEDQHGGGHQEATEVPAPEHRADQAETENHAYRREDHGDEHDRVGERIANRARWPRRRGWPGRSRRRRRQQSGRSTRCPRRHGRSPTEGLPRSTA